MIKKLETQEDSDSIADIAAEFDLGFDAVKLKNILTPRPKPTVQDLEFAQALADDDLANFDPTTAADSDYIKLVERKEAVDQELELRRLEEAEAGGEVDGWFGQSVNAITTIGPGLLGFAVDTYIEDDSKYSSVVSKGKDLAISPTTDPAAAVSFYNTLEKTKAKEERKDGSRNPKAKNSFLTSLIGQAIEIGSSEGTSDILNMFDDPEDGRDAVLKKSDSTVAKGDVGAIKNVVGVTGKDRVRAKHPKIENEIFSNYTPDKSKTPETRSTDLIGLMTELGTNWDDVNIYDGITPECKADLINPDVEGYEYRELGIEIHQAYA